MSTILVGLFLVVPLSAFSANLADPNGRTAIYKFFELVPNQKLVLNLEIGKRCSDPSKEQLTIEDFESSKDYPSIQTGKPASVRIKHYYIESFSPCENEILGKITRQITIGPFKDKMTHIKFTTSENVKVYNN
ncbi:MAG: hypothetical protein ACOYL6_00730 [Bacteriovoracaceae bacterium]